MKAYRIHAFYIFLNFIFCINVGIAQVKKNAVIVKDSIVNTDSIYTDSTGNNEKNIAWDSLLIRHKYINAGTPVSFIVKHKLKKGKEFLFYLISIHILLVAIFKLFYAKYFNNIFRVFFNTSFRQNQLTDLLLQAKQPSFILNVIFIVNGGIYAWLIFNYYQTQVHILPWLFILALAIMYSGKFVILKLTGWISGMKKATNQYIFVIFLINKIMGIVLLPFIVLLAFAPGSWFGVISIISFLVIIILFLLRYLRSYGLVQGELKISSLHFLLYIIGMELIPLLLIYKILTGLA